MNLKIFKFGFQSAAVQTHVAPLVTDTVRSHIQFGDHEMNGSSAASPKHMANGSASSTPSQNGRDISQHCESFLK